MPTYEYECSQCKRVFEIRQRISEPPLTTCDRCGGEVRRLLSPAPFILKGGGWYVTDYPSESRKQAIKSESSAPTGAQSSTADGGASSSSGDSGGSSSNGAGSSDGAKAKPAAKSASKSSKKGKD